MKRCPSCGTPRGNVRRGWEPIEQAGAVVGYTCPDCPEWGEPIARVETAQGVRWTARVSVTPPGARQRRQSRRTFSTLTEAREWVVEVREGVRSQGTYAAPARLTVADLGELWRKRSHTVREVTMEHYDEMLKYVNHETKGVGHIPADELTLPHVDAWVQMLARCGGRVSAKYPEGRPLGQRTVRGALKTLRMVLDYGVRSELIGRNVATGVEVPKTASPSAAAAHWAPAELIAFRTASDHDSLAAAWRLTLSGLTRADVMGLRWEDVDLEAGTVTVSQGRVQSISRGGETYVDDPKSAQRARTVHVEDMHPGTVELLRALKARQARHQLKAGAAWHASGYVVVDELGRPVRPEWYSDRFRALCRKAGVPTIRLHAVRHSMAFLLHAQGATPADAAALLGHTTEVHLASYLPASGNDGVARAGQKFGEWLTSAATGASTAPGGTTPHLVARIG
ncbi:site-specific integrase [Micrococcus luteus]|uniref:tyrosine-type recombinase/integrase n=1 Tax=Micrococcus luteus TaxID=1270 RepID=UPI00204037F6|nr:site-specific integrase [Micrococcus luteus]MCM3576940.1 site-specific integrase [Micrococcus luteus]